MTFPVQVATRAGQPPYILAMASLRYEAVRTITPKQFAALHRSAMLHSCNDTFEDAFDRLVDAVLATNEAREREKG